MKLLPSLFDPSLHLNEYEIEEFHACPACGIRNNRDRKRVGRLQENPSIFLLKCPCCNGVSASHRPKPDTLSEYYKNHFSKHYKNFNKNSDVTFSDLQRFSAHLKKMMSKELNSSFKDGDEFVIVDYGGGDGALALEYANTLSNLVRIKIFVIDFGENVCKTNKNNIEILKFNGLSSVAKRADLIIASACLEHIPDLRDVFSDLWGVLKVGGFFYARTPYVVPLKKFLPIEFGYPAHIHDLGSDYWNNLKESYGVHMNYISSRPSIIEVSFRRNPFRYIITGLLKFPCHLAVKLSPCKKGPYFWPFVGGWEVLLKKDGGTNV